ncbi:MAG: M4 family metallopeptidase [Anaerolineales bacterium]
MKTAGGMPREGPGIAWHSSADSGPNPVLCILPPHVLKNLYSNGSDVQKQIALASIVGSARLRGRRASAPHVAAMRGAAESGGKRRRVFTADNTSTLPGRLLRAEGQPASTDAAANEAYDGAGLTYDLYWDVYGRDSLDGLGMLLDSSVHYRTQYDNAFWDGQQMVYGDGDGQLFNRFTLAVDVIGHELTHGVTQYTCNLQYSDQSGALNESLSDIFGSLVKQRHRGQTVSEADWLIGEGLFTSRVKGSALRSMKEPGTAYDDPVLGRDPQPAHMRDYVHTTDDDGGIHINSGIPNHAFFLAATAMGGFAWDKAGKIWYAASRDKFSADTDFSTAAQITYQTAAELFGDGGDEQKAVAFGWESVGIPVTTVEGSGATVPPATSSGGCATAVPALLRNMLAARPSQTDAERGAGARR